MFKTVDGNIENFIVECESILNNQMEILELKILMSDIKKWIDEFSSRLNRAEEKLSKLDNWLVKRIEWSMETKKVSIKEKNIEDTNMVKKKSNTGVF